MDAIEFFFEWLQIDFRQFDVRLIMKFYPKELIKCVKTEHMLNAAVASE